jgi:hypothetical protein
MTALLVFRERTNRTYLELLAGARCGRRRPILYNVAPKRLDRSKNHEWAVLCSWRFCAEIG